MKRYLSLIGLVLWFVSGCDDVVESKILEIKEKVFIVGFISPQNDSLSINISRTLPALGLELSLFDQEENLERFLVRDATVRISNESGNNITLPFLEEKQRYTESAINFPILPGKEYMLEVMVDGTSYVASCTVPEENITDVTETIRIREDEFGSTTYTLDMAFDDIQNTDNFYLLDGFLEIDDQEDDFSNNKKDLFFDLDGFKTDNVGDGLPITASVDFFPFKQFNENGEIEFTPSQELIIQVLNAEESLYGLLRSNYLNDINEGNPFIELSVFPNTISGEGATGIFAAYQYFEKRVPLEELE